MENKAVWSVLVIITLIVALLLFCNWIGWDNSLVIALIFILMMIISKADNVMGVK